MSRKTLWIAALTCFATAVFLGWQPVTLEILIDVCLDRGGSFDYANRTCDFVNEHAAPAQRWRAAGPFLGAAVALIAGLVFARRAASSNGRSDGSAVDGVSNGTQASALATGGFAGLPLTLTIALLVALLIGLLTALIMTLLDWRLNPGGLFRGEAGTNWPVVIDTALSWFLPVFASASLVAALVSFLRFRLNRKRTGE